MHAYKAKYLLSLQVYPFQPRLELFDAWDFLIFFFFNGAASEMAFVIGENPSPELQIQHFSPGLNLYVWKI